MISFPNAQVLVKIKLACSKVLLLINYLLVTYKMTNIFFIKVGVGNVLLKISYLELE